MKQRLSRRIFLSGLAATLPGVALAKAPLASLRPRARGKGLLKTALGGVEDLIARFGLSGRVACAVADVKTGLRLEAANGDAGLPPASVTKALTALYALETLGPEHRFQTQVLVSGGVENGILNGDLILAGGGDPTLDTNGLAALASKLKAGGIREVRGDFLVFEGALPFVKSIDPGQPDEVGYSPAVSGLALNFNRVHFEWKRLGKGYGVTMQARTDRYRPDVSMARMQLVSRQAPVYTYGDKGGRDEWTVARGALGKGGSRWLPVRRPGAYAGDVFRTLARSNGVVLKPARIVDRLPDGRRVVASVASAELVVILRDMMKYSNNLIAEMVGLSATIRRGGTVGSLKQSGRAMSDWAKDRFGMKATRLVDHSGLGPDSRMTAHELVSTLVAARQAGPLRALMKPIAMRDSRGRTVKGHPIKVDAKTGTLNFVSGLGGYMTAADGTELAFAIFAADTKRRAGLTRAQRVRPDGARGWNRQAKKLQQRLIERWGQLYGS